jgi:hypothetical protein
VATTAVGSVAARATSNQYQPYNDVIEIDQGLINGNIQLLARDSLAQPLLINDDTDADNADDVEDPMNSAAATSAPVVPSANKLHARFFGKRNNQLATIGALRRSQAAEAKKHTPAAPAPKTPATAKAPATAPTSTSTSDEADDEGDDEDVNAADADMLEAMERRAAVPRNLIDVNTGNGRQGSNPYLVNAWIGGNSAGSSKSSSSHKSSSSKGKSNKSSPSNKKSSKKNNGGSHKSSSSSKKASTYQQQQQTGYNGNVVQVDALNGGGNLLDLSLRKRLLSLALGGTDGGSSNGASGGAANGKDVTVTANGEDCDADDESEAYLVNAQFQRRRYDDSSDNNSNSDDNSSKSDSHSSKHGKGSKKDSPTLADIQAQQTKLQGEIAQLGNATTADSAAMNKRQMSADQLNQLLQGMSPSTLAQVQSIGESLRKFSLR